MQDQLPMQSDILINLYSNAFNLESKLVANAGATEMVLVAGAPMDDNVPVEDGGEANTDGLLMDSHRIPAGESKAVAVLARGPATCRTAGVPVLDWEDDTLVPATIITAMEALGVVFRDEPETTETQTT
jgi:hypothetical protein